MAANYIEANPANQFHSRTLSFIRQIREAVNGLAAQRDAMIQMRDGDGSSAAHYDVAAQKIEYVANDYADANAAAKASFDELDSLLSKVNTNNAVSNVRAAIDQVCAKHGV